MKNLPREETSLKSCINLKTTLNIQWSRDISIYGRENIVKTLAISKVIFICSALDTPKGFTDEVNNVMSITYGRRRIQNEKNKATVIKNKE